ncbi:MAG: metallophosphoesterase [Candidatus Hydrogenedentes bacterium]|nr:metallophosphoesterase [Candidatus Hydrogenedentota bacterium]
MKLTRREFIGLVGALGLSSCASTHIPLIGGGDKGPFKVAAMNDLHVVDARSMTLINKAVARIGETKDVRLAVVIGDLSTSAKLSEFNMAKESLKGLKIPYLVVPGNHDVEPRAAHPFGTFEKVFGPAHWVHEEDGWTFIGLNSCEGASSDVTIGADELDWLRKQVKHISNGRPIGLFLHHPLNPNTKSYRVKNAEEVLGVFSGKKLKLAAAGHYHGNQVEERDGVLFTTTACCSSSRDNFDQSSAKGYRLFTFDGDTVTNEFVEVGG